MSGEAAIGVDLGGTKLAAGIVDRDGAVVRQTVSPTVHSSQEELLAALERAIAELLDDDDVGAVGVGVPSTIDQAAGRAVSSVNVPLAGVDLRADLSARFGVPVAIENDANAAALAEHRFGAGRGTRHMVMLTLGTGIGGGLILDGRLYRGAVGAAAELGHITLDLDGGPCQGFCPGRGHFEVLASGTAARLLAERLAAKRKDGGLGRAVAAGRRVDARLVSELAAAGDPDALEVLETIGSRLGVALADFVNVLNPEVIVIGGGFAQAGDLLFGPARRVIAERALPPGRDLVRIVSAELGAQAGLVGAALVAYEALAEGPEAVPG
jgi:glucokinase